MISKSELSESRVLVIGDVMLDKWSYHEQTRISPEAPVPIIKEKSSFYEIGGAGNALRHLDALTGRNNRLITVIGDDDIGGKACKVIEAANYSVNYEILKSRRTTLKNRFFLDNQLVFRIDTEEVTDIPFETEASLMATLNAEIKNFDVILISDYAKGVLTHNLVHKIIALSRAQNIPVVTDPGFGRLAIYRGCTAIKPNAAEWNEFVISVGNEESGLKDLFDHGTEYVLITQGASGVRLITQDFEISLKPERDVRVVDVTGAGDSVAAALSLLVGSGHSVSENLQLLNNIGAETVQKAKTQL